ncbi:MAG: sigma-70 family RNA polymerase sigma factor [Deltaproteobacteria bacterium]|nr:sigma-70 family RNA polymerase sigma factor [Deltaproteobacteria bacterium]
METSDACDEALLGRFVAGDQDAFEILFRRFQAQVYRWIFSIVRDPAAAEDVLAESFWRAYRARARFDSRRSFGAWMRRIATNASLDYWRDERRRRTAGRLQPAPATPDGADPALREAIEMALDRLSPKLRIVATLALIEERPYAEISEATGLPVGTIKSRVSRATARLKDELSCLGVRS